MPLVVCVQLDSGRVDKKGINDFAYIIGRSSGAQRGKRIYNIIVLMVAYRHHLPSLLFNRVSNDEGTDPLSFLVNLIGRTDGRTDLQYGLPTIWW